MGLGGTFCKVFPGIIMPAVTNTLRQESKAVILPSEDELLKPHIEKRRKTGTRLNLNQLGEAILGEEEAKHRLEAVLERLRSPDVEYISVKISAIFSQINLVAYRATVEEIKNRVRTLYRTGMKHTFTKADGSQSPKFVNLDMEEYRDLNVTTAAFKEVLDEPEFLKLAAGIVLQAYLPDSHVVQQDLTAWSRARVSRGGAPIKIRIVKGANLAMEKVEAAMHHWAIAPYDNKPDVDANYKRMVNYAMQPENAAVVRIGIASHNLFDIAYALLMREVNGVADQIEFEMLEGMANHQASAVQDTANGLLLYAPVVKKEDFHSAIAYLVRRLDENTSDENFLHDLFGLKVDSPEWKKQSQWFLEAVRRADVAPIGPNRKQDRATEKPVALEGGFQNDIDTDWALPANRKWVLDALAEWKDKAIDDVPLQVAGEFIKPNTDGKGLTPNARDKVVYRYALAGQAEIDKALAAAKEARKAWEARPIAERRRILGQVAVEIAKARAEAIGVMSVDAGKAAWESDVEISEAIDFANYYGSALDFQGQLDECESKALGTIVVTPPWNFPFAIPAGGVLAALMAGNAVIMKPASDTVLTAWSLMQCFWRAGVPKEVCQFLPCPGKLSGKFLIQDPRVAGVILTGGYSTARMFQDLNPRLRLFAETSGKDSMVITGAADPDQAVKDLVKSAFGHSGQKCSAASLAILEAEVYDNPAFRKQLRDAAASLAVGPATDPSSLVTPVIRPPADELLRGLTQLDAGEEWLLEPRQVGDNPCLWSPGIRLGVKRGSWFHKTECFGPVLGIMRAENLEDAIAIQNDSDFGLTGGLQSIDDREIAIWREKVEVGNAYINRPITGAIVRRQPFGGWKKSCFGPGAKAGGPNYVMTFATWTQKSLPKQRASASEDVAALVGRLSAACGEGELLAATAESCAYAWAKEYGVEHDPSALYCESNVFRYRPRKGIVLRGNAGATAAALAQARIAAATAKVTVTVSVDPSLGLDPKAIDALGGATVEDEAAFASRLPSLKASADAIRLVGSASDALYRAANDAPITVLDAPVVASGRRELQNYLREQSISTCLHRYGNIIPKGRNA